MWRRAHPAIYFGLLARARRAARWNVVRHNQVDLRRARRLFGKITLCFLSQPVPHRTESLDFFGLSDFSSAGGRTIARTPRVHGPIDWVRPSFVHGARRELALRAKRPANTRAPRDLAGNGADRHDAFMPANNWPYYEASRQRLESQLICQVGGATLPASAPIRAIRSSRRGRATEKKFLQRSGGWRKNQAVFFGIAPGRRVIAEPKANSGPWVKPSRCCVSLSVHGHAFVSQTQE